MRHTRGFAVAVALVALAGCSSSSGGSASSGTRTGTAGTSTAARPTDSAAGPTTASDPSNPSSSASTSSSSAAPSSSEAASSATDGLPGGTVGKQTLSAHKLLDDKGRVAPGPTAPKGKKLNAAICDYVFGTASEVGKTAKLSGTVELAGESGYKYNGGGGEGVQCLYRAGGKEIFVLGIWSKAADDTSTATEVVQVSLRDGFHGISGYAPDYDGATMDRVTNEHWLTEAGSRVSHGSV